MRPIHKAARRSLIALAANASLLFLLLGGPGSEAAMVPQTVEQLAANSTHIVRGEVLYMHSQWDPSHSYIYTTVGLRITQQHKGDPAPAEIVTIYVPGGVVADTGLGVEHAAQFEIGQDVVVFLTQVEELFAVTSHEQGKYTVINGQVAEKRTPVTEFVNEIKRAVQR